MAFSKETKYKSVITGYIIICQEQVSWWSWTPLCHTELIILIKS